MLEETLRGARRRRTVLAVLALLLATTAAPALAAPHPAVADPAPAVADPAPSREPLEAARARFEASVGPLDPAAYRPPGVEAEANAAHWFLAGAAALELVEDDRELLRGLVQRRPADWTGEERERLDSLLARQSRALALLHRGGRSRASAFPPLPAEGASESTTEALPSLPAAARVLLVAGLLELEKTPDASPSLEVLAALAGRLGEQPEALYRLLAVSAEAHFLVALHRAVEDPATRPELLGALAGRLSGRSAAEEFSRVVAFEASLGVERVDRLDPADATPGWTEEIAMLDELRRMAESAREPADFARHLEETAANPETTGQVVTALLMPNFQDTLARLQANEASRQLARAAVAARLAAGVTGAYPARLGDLGIDLEADPFAGSEPEYQRGADGSAVLANPAAAAAWGERAASSGAVPLPFHWHLPPAG